MVKTYCGHGIGEWFHCAPNIPHYRGNKAVGTMKEGQVGCRLRSWPYASALQLQALNASTYLCLPYLAGCRADNVFHARRCSLLSP